jgi:hypothetical protein
VSLFGLSTAVVVQDRAPAVGVLELSTSPASSTATQSVADEHDTPVSEPETRAPAARQTGAMVRADAEPLVTATSTPLISATVSLNHRTLERGCIVLT